MRRKVTNVERVSENKLQKLKFKLFAGLIIGSIVVGGVTYNVHNTIKDITSYPENTYGYTDIMPGNFIKAQENTFVLLDAGDYNTTGEFLFDKKINYCAENNMSIGIVINEKDTNLNAIYRDVELVKSLIEKYEGIIDLPVYFNIDGLIENDRLNNTQKIELITTFLEKCQSNGIYVGVQGTNENLTRLKTDCKISEYDACVILDKDEELTYDGICNLIQTHDGIVRAITNLSPTIKESNLNSKEKFVNDSIYVISNNETILDVSLKFNISVYDLLKFNELNKKDIKEGTVLRIPSVLGKSIPNERKKVTVNEPLYGCDISHYQSTYFDASKLKENFDFVILKATEGISYEDKSFPFFAKECIKNDIAIGAYVLNRVENINDSIEDIESKIENQTDFFLNTISNNRIDYPVYLDLEGTSEPMLLNNPEGFKKILEVWYQKVTDAGYTPGLYMNSSMYKSMINSNIINTDEFNVEENFEMWIAGNPKYYLSESPDNQQKLKNTHFSIEEVKPNTNPLDVDMVQPTNVGDGKTYGAANASGHLDLCFSYKDYEKDESENIVTYDEILKTKESLRLPNIETVGICSTIGGVPLLSIAAGIFIHRKRKNKVR